MNILLLNYTGNESNWGCQATSKNLISMISKKSNISLDSIDIEYQGSFYRMQLNRIRFYTVSLIPINYMVSFFTRIFKLLHPLELENIKKINNSEILILNGEGSLHGYNYELMKFLQYAAYAKEINKKVFIVNHSLQFDNDQSKKYLEKLYKHSDMNFFREEFSIKNSKLINVSNSYLVPDAAFLNYYINTDKVDLSHVQIPKKYILASGSIALKNNSRGYFDLLQMLGEYYKLPIVFIASCEVDKSFEKLVSIEYGFLYYDDTTLCVEHVQKLIKESEFFYSGRFHLNIFAATAGKIFIPFKSNTVKMKGFLNLIQYPMEEIDFDGVDVNSRFKSIVDVISSSKDVIEKKLLENAKKIAQDIERKYMELLS